MESKISAYANGLNWHEIREKVFWGPNCNQLMQKYVHSVRRMYNHYQKIISMKQTFNLESALNLLKAARDICIYNLEEQGPGEEKGKFRCSFHVSMFEIRTCFNLSKMTLKDTANAERSQHLAFVEFLEFLCRLAYVCRAGSLNAPFEEISGVRQDQLRYNDYIARQGKKVSKNQTYAPPLWLFQGWVGEKKSE